MLFFIPFFALSGCAFFIEGDEGLSLAPLHIQPIELQELAVPFTHQWAKGESYHLVGSAAIDVDEDGRFEVFIGGGLGQDDVLLSYRAKGASKVINKIKTYGLSSKDATYGATAMDVDNNGKVDLIVLRDKGVTVYYKSQKGKFTPVALPLSLPPHSVALNATPIDIEKDGDIDLYISVFIDSKIFRSVTYNDPTHLRRNFLLRNDGVRDGKVRWTDITNKTTASSQNSFTALAVDLNGDRLQDIIIAQNTGQVELLRNLGKGKFKRESLKTGHGFWMGIGAGDVDRDGDVDLVFSNTGSSITSAILMGDLKEGQNFNGAWILQRNDGNFRFKDIAAPAHLSELGFGWGAVFEDMNFDGALDMFAAQNYINWPLHHLYRIESKILVNDPKAQPSFYKNRGEGGKNAYFTHTPLLVDFDGDGKKDLFWVNSDGPLKLFLNKTMGNHFVAVQVPDNVLSLGAVIELSFQQGKTMRQQITSAQGLTTDQPPVFVFGLGASGKAKRLTIVWSNGKKTIVNNPAIDKVLQLKP